MYIQMQISVFLEEEDFFVVEIYQLASFAMCNLFGGKPGQMVRAGCNCKQKADFYILLQIGSKFSLFSATF